MKTIHVQYFAVLREQARRGEETLATDAHSPADLYEALKDLHGLTLPRAVLRVAVN
jgi:molybdopterin converting factor small subunit